MREKAELMRQWEAVKHQMVAIEREKNEALKDKTLYRMILFTTMALLAAAWFKRRELLVLMQGTSEGTLTVASAIGAGGMEVPVSTAAEAWKRFEEIMPATVSVTPNGDKFIMPADYFIYGDVKAFKDGLPGMLNASGGQLLNSMEEEFRKNDDGKWWAEYEYVVKRCAELDVDLPSTEPGEYSVSGVQIVRDAGHAGMSLDDFQSHEFAQRANLSRAEVAALRLYTGPCYKPLNRALRTQQIDAWATTIGCCYSAVLSLSFLSEPTRVYRGVKEDERQLPPDFLKKKGQERKFAGGVERAFMSTTKSREVALDFSGDADTQGSIFVIDFDMSSRGANVQFLSQYPHEQELCVTRRLKQPGRHRT